MAGAGRPGPRLRRTSSDCEMAAGLAMAAAAAAGLGRLLSPVGARAYHARPLRRQLGGVYRPDPSNPRTPAWQLEPAYEAKLYGRHGAASGVDPARLWPSAAELAALEAEERELFPSLREMQAALDAEDRRQEDERRRREELIATRMAKMPQMIAEWRRERQERKIKEQEEKERRQLLLAEVRERLGYNVDHRSPEFQEMMKEMEKAKRKEMKLQKKQRREEAVAKRAEKAAAAAAQSAKDGEAEAAASPSQAT